MPGGLATLLAVALAAVIYAGAALLLGALALFGAWSLWDIAATRRAALPEQTLRFKPLAAAPADSPGFAELRALNPDVCGWLTLDGTRIDFPVVQGADNMVYVNTDVYGDFSLSGAIFLDSRCPADFTAPYSIVYGHHIEDNTLLNSGLSKRIGNKNDFREFHGVYCYLLNMPQKSRITLSLR